MGVAPEFVGLLTVQTLELGLCRHVYKICSGTAKTYWTALVSEENLHYHTNTKIDHYVLVH